MPPISPRAADTEGRIRRMYRSNRALAITCLVLTVAVATLGTMFGLLLEARNARITHVDKQLRDQACLALEFSPPHSKYAIALRKMHPDCPSYRPTPGSTSTRTTTAPAPTPTPATRTVTAAPAAPRTSAVPRRARTSSSSRPPAPTSSTARPAPSPSPTYSAPTTAAPTCTLIPLNLSCLRLTL